MKGENGKMKSDLEQTEIEAPYELPEGWKWCRLGALFEVLNGYAFKSDNYVSNGIRVIRITNVQDGYVEDLKPCFYSMDALDTIKPYLLYENDLLISLTGNVGRIALMPKRYLPAALNQRVGCLRPTNSNVCKEFFSYFLRQPQFLNDCIKSSKGTAQLNMSTEWLKMYAIPLPPTLAEQQRIVNRIESMFSKLDEAKEKAQNVVDGFETRKAAILHKAFTGELTAKWRKENDVNDDSWEKKRFDEVAEIKSNLVDIAEYQDFPHIAPDNIEKKTGVLLEYHTVAEDKVTSGKHRFYAGQILYSKIRPYLSKVVIVDFDGVCSADMYPIEAKGNTRFLWYQMLSNEFLDKASNSGSRSVLPKINQKELSIIPMRTCSLPEQQEIVRILDSVLEKESRAKEAAQTVLEQIALLKKSILARAFRGEL